MELVVQTPYFRIVAYTGKCYFHLWINIIQNSYLCIIVHFEIFYFF